MKDKSSELVLVGPAGTGKSRTALEKMHAMALYNPGMKGLIVRKTAVSLTTSALQTYEKDVADCAIIDGSVSWFGGSAREPAQYRYSNGSTLAVGGMDKPLKIMSTEYDVIFAQEATELTIDDWEAMNSRLRNGRMSFQQLLADCNPSHPTHFLKQRADRGALTLLPTRHEDNPAYFDENGVPNVKGAAYMARLDALTGVRRLRLKNGLWAAAEGVIYEEWNDSAHLVDRFDVPDSWTRYWSIDFGFVHPFVWQDWAVDPDGQLVLVREIYMTSRIVEDHARQIKELHTDPKTGQWVGPRPFAIVTDHDAEDRKTFERHMGMGTVAANKNVSEGINAFKARLRVRGNGKPGLVIMRDAPVERDSRLFDGRKPTSTAEEVPGYIWAVGKEQPVKIDDDGMDAARYVVAEIDLRGETRVRTKKR